MLRLSLLLLLSLALPVNSAFAQSTVTIEQTPAAVRSGKAQLVGHYDPTQMLRLVFALNPPHLAEEEAFLNQLQDPQSYLFHHYLSSEEWNRRFAPSAEDEQAMVAWATSQGLSITQRYPNRLLVDVEAPARVIEKAFNVSINRYQIGSETYFSNDRDPAVPASLGGAVGAVLGLNNIEVMHAASRKFDRQHYPDYSPGPAYALGSHLEHDSRKTGSQGRKRGVGTDFSWSGLDPVDIYSPSAYDYQALQNLGHCCNPLGNPDNSPPPSSIAIVIWGDFSEDDFNGFINWETFIGTPLAANVQRYFIDGTPTCCDPETTLDVEWSTAMANSFDVSSDTAEIHVYEGANSSDSTLVSAINRALNDGYARVLNMSWGAAENYEIPLSAANVFHHVFDEMAGEGWSLVASAGDGGATTDCADHLSVSYPASDPDVTAAGGTELDARAGSYYWEHAWSGGPQGCANNDGGGGGGCSTFFKAPGYQSKPACGPGGRSLPDISLNSDWVNSPQNFYYDGNMYGGGGTSVAAPEISGFYAQENAYLLYIQSIVGQTCGPSLSAPCAPLGNANWYLYYEGINAPYAAHYPFYDILHQCNGNDITQKYHLTPFCAGPGYDRATGWGSVNMLQLAWMMNTFVAGDFSAPTVTLSGPATYYWYTSDQNIDINIADNGGNGHLPNGVAGYTAYWDTDPGDIYSEGTPMVSGNDQDNPFYYGPANPNSSSDVVDLLSMPTEGCHNLIVRAWDNAGQASSAAKGAFCYDIIPPASFFDLLGNFNGEYFIGPVSMPLWATDNASGVASTWYNVNEGTWHRYVWPINEGAPGSYLVGFYSMDEAGNVENAQYIAFQIYSNTLNSFTVYKTGTGSGTVIAQEGGINCGTLCTNNFYGGTGLTLTPTPSPGSVFAGWSGCDELIADNCMVVVKSNNSVTASFAPSVALRFVPLAPCRVVDTRLANGPLGGPPISGGSRRDFPLPEGACGIPGNAAAYSLNVTVVPNAQLGYLTVWPTGQTQPLISTLNSLDGRIKANAAIVPAGAGGAVSVYASDTTNVVLDISGYFVPSNSSALAFFPLTPCRVVDTRNANGDLGGPYLSGREQRDFPVLESACNLPATAQAYSFNFTAVAREGGPLGYLTVWPAGQSQPLVSTLNDLTGTIVANAGIVPAGTGGAISVYPNDDTDLVIDTNGYFAPADSGANPLSLYALLPCRAIDTRQMNGEFSGELTANIGGSSCAVPSAQAYVLNATVVPFGPLGYLTLWPDGSQQPQVSTLNAIDLAITSNMAIVPTTNGSVDAYVAGTSQLILDISSYFAP